MAYFNAKRSEISKQRRCNLLGINRSRIYYVAKPVTDEAKEVETKIYEIWDKHNFKGSRTIKEELLEYHSTRVNRKRVQRIMRKTGIKGILPKQNLSKPGELQYKHPYYLGGMVIYMANQVWGTDITYVKLPTGTMYVICLLDLFSRCVVSHVITNTLDTSGCIECFEQAVKSCGKPILLNSDQGSQFTSNAWVNKLNESGIAISMDGKGRWVDNVYVERFWRTLKRECIYNAGIESVEQLKSEVSKYIQYYNTYRLHSSLGYRTPYSVYKESKNLNPEFIGYCNWPPEIERTIIRKKAVLPTIGQKEVLLM